MSAQPTVGSLQGIVAQCVGFVRAVFPWVPGGPAYATQYAPTLQSLGYSKVTQAAQAAAGDILIIPAGMGGTGVAGHIAVVTGADSAGNLTVAQANWGPNSNSGAGTVSSLMSIPASAVAQFTNAKGGGGGVFAPPMQLAAQAQENAYLAAQSVQAHGGTYYSLGGGSQGNPLAPIAGQNGFYSGAPHITTDTVNGNAADCQPLGVILSQSGGSAVLGGIPLVGGLWTAATTPEKLIQWAIQPCVRWRIALGLGALVVLYFGVRTAFPKQVQVAEAPIKGAARAAATAAAA